MADASIIDIGGVQWNVKDKDARDRITTLEEKTTIKITKKIDEANIKMNLVEINGEKFIQLHFSDCYWSGVIGETIANFTNDFNLTGIVRCIINLDFSDRTGRCTADLDIHSNGVIKVYPQLINMFEGSYKNGYLYGDAFIKIQH